MKNILLIFLLAVVSQNAKAQDTLINKIDEVPKPQPVYKIKNAIDLPITGATVGWSLYGMSKIYSREQVPVTELNALKVSDINSFDRPVADNYSEKAKDLSDKFFYGSMPLPLILMADKRIRKDALKIGVLYLEAMGATGTLYTSSAMIVNRFRPYAYNTNVGITTRQRGGARNSFFAGHPAVVATSTFFMAKVYSDYHPEMRNKWILYTLAGAATATTGILRIKAGQHFYSDVITGVTVGTLSGILIPHFHKNKSKEQRLSIYPDFQMNSTGLRAVINL